MTEVMNPSLPSYDVYKDSGIPGVGKVPKHWETLRLKHWVGLNESVLPDSTDPDLTFRYMEISAVDHGRLIEFPQTTHFAIAPSRARRKVKRGDTLLSTVRTYLKAIWYAKNPEDDLVCSTGFAVLTPKKGTHPKYVNYLIQSEPFTDRVTAESVGTAYPAISENKLASFEVLVPSPNEQAAIVRYLDDADQRIRAYVSAKERLIGLLEEERQAIIQEAVTRGLDPNVKLKPSGVEWLGDVPEHWEVRKLKRVCSQHAQYGGNIPASEYTTSGIRFLRTTDITEKGELVGEGVYISPYFSPDHTLNDGDILLTRSGATIGQSFLYQSKKHGPCSYAGYLVRFVPNVEMLPRYIYLFTLTTSFQNSVQQTAITSTIQNVNAEKYANIHLPIPLLNEQIRIVKELDKSTKGIDAAINCASRQIDLIDEYRARLIADVVTGKLDVRDAAERLPEPDGEDSLTERQSLSNPTINVTL